MAKLRPDIVNDTAADASVSADFTTRIAALRTAGAAYFDPLVQHYLEALARRAATHQGSVRHLLDARLAQALEVFAGRFELARSEAAQAIAETVAVHPHQADALQRFFAVGDLKGLIRHLRNVNDRDEPSPLAGLVRQLEQQSADPLDARPQAQSGARAELKILRSARNTWSRLSVDRQVARALGQGPKNAGPINSHMLVLRSLVLMRDVSPDYLHRFMSYADTLLTLDRYEKDKPATAKKTLPAKATKK